MPYLPHNIERLRDHRGGYRYIGYTADGRAARISRDRTSRLWHAYAVGAGFAYVGCGRTLADLGAKLGAFNTKGN